MSEYEEAISSYEDALELQFNVFPADHLDIAATQKLLGLGYLQTKQLDEARSNLLKCLDIQTKKLPHDHPDLMDTRDLIQRLL